MQTQWQQRALPLSKHYRIFVTLTHTMTLLTADNFTGLLTRSQSPRSNFSKVELICSIKAKYIPPWFPILFPVILKYTRASFL